MLATLLPRNLALQPSAVRAATEDGHFASQYARSRQWMSQFTWQSRPSREYHLSHHSPVRAATEARTPVSGAGTLPCPIAPHCSENWPQRTISRDNGRQHCRCNITNSIVIFREFPVPLNVTAVRPSVTQQQGTRSHERPKLHPTFPAFHLSGGYSMRWKLHTTWSRINPACITLRTILILSSHRPICLGPARRIFFPYFQTKVLYFKIPRSDVSHACYIPRPYHLSWFHRPEMFCQFWRLHSSVFENPLKMKTAGSFETSGSTHPATQRHIPEERKIQFPVTAPKHTDCNCHVSFTQRSHPHGRHMTVMESQYLHYHSTTILRPQACCSAYMYWCAAMSPVLT
jgi:hypothetical protein